MNRDAALIRVDRRGSSARPWLTLKEAVVLADVPERRVRKDIETGILKAMTAWTTTYEQRLCFSWDAVPPLAAIYEDQILPSSLRKLALDRIWSIGFTTTKSSARLCGEKIEFENGPVTLGKYLTLDIRSACLKVSPRLDIYESGLARMTTDPEIMGGVPVFADTRLPVTHIGKLAEDGESADSIVHDYPALSQDDVEFARLYYRAHPPVGRPRKSGGAPDGGVADR